MKTREPVEKRAIGKCSRCKKVVAINLWQEFYFWGSNSFGREIWKHASFTCRDMKAPAVPKYCLLDSVHADGVSVPCPECSRAVWCKVVKGVKTETPCDGRCTSARGHVCECSCGGANHGASHC